MRLKIFLSDGSLVHEFSGKVIRRDIAGPDEGRTFWLVQTDTLRFVEELPPTNFLLIGAGGKAVRLESLDDGVGEGAVIQAMLDWLGRVPEIDSFDWPSVCYFAKGIVQRTA
jgi:hypothetical protein